MAAITEPQKHECHGLTTHGQHPSVRPMRMPRNTLLCLVAAVAVTKAAPVAAVERVDLYLSRMAVEDSSPEAASLAVEAALAEFLVRVTGDAASASSSLYAGLRPRVEELVSERGYVSLPGRVMPDGTLTPARSALQVRFEPEAARQALESAGVRIWSPVRPVTLALIGIGQGAGFEWVTEEDALGVADSLRDYSSRLGLPLRLPELPPDTALLAAGGDALQQSLQNLRTAAGADAVLLGAIESTADGSNTATWRLLDADGLSNWTAAAPDLDTALVQSLGRLGSHHAALALAEAPSNAGASEFSIVGVESFADWALLWNRLQAIEGGRSLQPVRLEAGRIVLRTDLPGGGSALLLDPALSSLVAADGDQWRLLR